MAHRVLIRADAGTHIGAGHVVRSLALADEFAHRGCSVTFATNCPPEISATLRGHGHGVVPIELAGDASNTPPGAIWSDATQDADAATIRRVLDDEFDTVVVDHYGLDARWEASVAGDRRVLVLDDLANRPHHCAVLCDQNWYGPQTAHRYEGLVDVGTVQLLGPRYAVLQEMYHQLRSSRLPITWPPQRVVVSFGGTDPYHETEKVVSSLMAPELGHLHVDVVVGSAGRVTETLERLLTDRPSSELHVAVPSLAPLLASCDLAIGASGAGTWERLCLGVPAIVATNSAHQSGVTEALAAAGMTDWMGLAADTTVEGYRAAIGRRISSPEPQIPPVVDGLGAARLAEALLPSPNSELVLRPATPADTPALAGLDGESTGSGPNLLDGPTTWLSEAMRLGVTDVDGAHGPLVVELRGLPVGGVWIDENGASSIRLQSAVQRRGLDADIERLLEEPPRSSTGP